MSHILSRRLYALFLRQLESTSKINNKIWLGKIPNIDDFQTFKTLPQNRAPIILKSILPKCLHDIVHENKLNSQYITCEELRSVITNSFRSHSEREIDDGFETFRNLSLQCRQNEMTSVTDTADMRVIISVIYSDMQSMAMDAGAVYYYRVTIENNSCEDVKVMGRHWDFQTERDRVQIPRYADGLIGQQPVIKPTEGFEYMSRIVLNYPLPGTMQGSFLCRKEKTGEEFEIFVDP